MIKKKKLPNSAFGTTKLSIDYYLFLLRQNRSGIDVAAGSVVWQFETGGQVEAAPVVAGRRRGVLRLRQPGLPRLRRQRVHRSGPVEVPDRPASTSARVPAVSQDGVVYNIHRQLRRRLVLRLVAGTHDGHIHDHGDDGIVNGNKMNTCISHCDNQ